MSERVILAQAGGQIAAAMAGAVIMPGESNGKTESHARDPELPNRLSIERDSPFYSSATMYVGVRINGSTEDEGNVVEYCVEGKWVRLGVRDGNGEIKRVPGKLYSLKTETRYGVTVEPYWRERPSRQVRRAMAQGK